MKGKIIKGLAGLTLMAGLNSNIQAEQASDKFSHTTKKELYKTIDDPIDGFMDEAEVPDYKELKKIFIAKYPDQKDKQINVLPAYVSGQHSGKIFEFFCHQENKIGSYIQDGIYFLYNSKENSFYSIDSKKASTLISNPSLEKDVQTIFLNQYPQYADMQLKIYASPNNDGCYEVVTSKGRFFVNKDSGWIVRINSYVSLEMSKKLIGKLSYSAYTSVMYGDKEAFDRFTKIRDKSVPVIKSVDRDDDIVLYEIIFGDNEQCYVVDKNGVAQFLERDYTLGQLEINHPMVYKTLTDRRNIIKKQGKNSRKFANSNIKKFRNDAEGMFFLNKQYACYRMISLMDKGFKTNIINKIYIDPDVYANDPVKKKKLLYLLNYFEVSKKEDEQKQRETNEFLLLYFGKLFDMTIDDMDFERLRLLALDDLINTQVKSSQFEQRYSKLSKETKKNALSFAYTRMYVGKSSKDITE